MEIATEDENSTPCEMVRCFFNDDVHIRGARVEPGTIRGIQVQVAI